MYGQKQITVCSRLVFGIWAVGNVMPCLTTVETGPSIVVIGGELVGIALRGFHGVLAPKLCVRGLGACHLGLGPILYWGLRYWCSIVGAPWFLETVLLASFAFQELALVFLPFFSLGPFCEDGHVHQSIEVWVYLRGKQCNVLKNSLS